MLSIIWGVMIIAGIVYAAANGELGAVTPLAIASAKSAVTLAITMAGVIALWSGLMNIAEESGLIALLTKKMQLILRLLFPKIPKNHAAHKYIATNFIANILGLGWAATPAGLKAMSALKTISRDKTTASNEMCLFMVVNMSSLQLISVNLLAYRMEHNSANPSEIIGPGIAVTVATTLIGIIVCKLAEKISDRNSALAKLKRRALQKNTFYKRFYERKSVNENFDISFGVGRAARFGGYNTARRNK